MKYKTKPIQRAEIREAVERKFRARGGILFHTLLFVLGSGLFLANSTDGLGETVRPFATLTNSLTLCCYTALLATSFCLHFFRYH